MRIKKREEESVKDTVMWKRKKFNHDKNQLKRGNFLEGKKSRKREK